MNRRNFFNKGVGVAVGAAVLGGVSVAQGADEGASGVLRAEISNNHGHELSLGLAELVAVLRKLQPENKVETVSIQGQSHPHSVALTFNEVLAVLLGEVVELESTNDFNHSHQVTLALDLEEV